MRGGRRGLGPLPLIAYVSAGVQAAFDPLLNHGQTNVDFTMSQGVFSLSGAWWTGFSIGTPPFPIPSLYNNLLNY